LYRDARVMSVELPVECRQLLQDQEGVLDATQAREAGITLESIKNQLSRGQWQRLQRGVYASFSGTPTRRAELWAALLRAGPGAILSHQSAAELYGLLDGCSPVIHITVPHRSNPARCGKVPGVVIHRSRSVALARHPALTPPRTRIDQTVLDLIDGSQTFDEAYDWICRAIGRRRTTAERIRAAMDARPRFRWRRDIELALSDASGGALSLLELRYVRGVERPHGLPVARRQARVRQQTGNRYLDNLYEEYWACVEVDGIAAHPEDEQWRDKRRDRWNSVHEKIETIRIGFLDLRDRQSQCETAADVAMWLSRRGLRVGHSCSRPGCPVPLLGVFPGAITPGNTPSPGGQGPPGG
jgi:Transcriptional regulator, AbiEi antitoxin